MSNKKNINSLKSLLFMIAMKFGAKSETTTKEQHNCLKCQKTFDEPELVQYYACPYCKNRIAEEKKKIGCQYWFGYLNQKSKCDSMPQSCVECEKVVECMLNRYYSSTRAVSEIKKWY
jgi:DNA-directed RNA polymerase subunit RPC12/RpoP